MTPFARLAFLALCSAYAAAVAALWIFVTAAVAIAAVAGVVLAVALTVELQPTPPARKPDPEGLSRRDVDEIVRR